MTFPKKLIPSECVDKYILMKSPNNNLQAITLQNVNKQLIDEFIQEVKAGLK